MFFVQSLYVSSIKSTKVAQRLEIRNKQTYHCFLRYQGPVSAHLDESSKIMNKMVNERDGHFDSVKVNGTTILLTIIKIAVKLLYCSQTLLMTQASVPDSLPRSEK